MIFTRRSSVTPAIVKIKGKPADVAFLEICAKEIVPGCQLRTTGYWWMRKPVVDADGYNELSLYSPNFLHEITIMAKQLGVELGAINYGSIPVDTRPRNKCTVTFTITRNGRHEEFDLSNE